MDFDNDTKRLLSSITSLDVIFLSQYERCLGLYVDVGGGRFWTFTPRALRETPKKAQLETFLYTVKYISSCIVDAISFKIIYYGKSKRLFLWTQYFFE